MKIKIYTMLVAMTLFNIGASAQQSDNDTTRVNEYGIKVERVPVFAEMRDGVLTLESADQNFKIWYDTRVQFDLNTFDSDVLNPIGNGVNIRRARFAIKTVLWKNWYGELDLDFAGSVVELKDAYLKYTFDSNKLNIKAGHFKEPLGMETTTTSRYLTFMERSFVSKLDASRHLGFQANYWTNKMLLTGGVFFRTVGEFEEVEIAEDFNKELGIDDGLSYTGRAVYAPIKDENKVLHLGVAATYRTPKVHAEIPNMVRYSTRSHSSINRKKYLDTDDIKDVDHVFGYNLELAGRYEGFMFQGEYKTRDIVRIEGKDLKTVKSDGFYVQGAYLLLGGNHNYNIAEGEFTRVTRGKDFGDLELAFRYDYINLNDFDAEVYGGSAESYTAGLNYYFNPNVKFMLNYTYNNHDRYANGKGKLYVGHDADGNLTKDPFEVVESEGNAGEAFGMWGVRFEINF